MKAAAKSKQNMTQLNETFTSISRAWAMQRSSARQQPAFVFVLLPNAALTHSAAERQTAMRTCGANESRMAGHGVSSTAQWQDEVYRQQHNGKMKCIVNSTWSLDAFLQSN